MLEDGLIVKAVPMTREEYRASRRPGPGTIIAFWLIVVASLLYTLGIVGPY